MAKTVLVLLILASCAYAIVAGVVFLAQTRMLFPVDAVRPPGALPPGAARLTLTAGGERLHGVHLPPAPGSPARPEIILGFGGNAWHAEAAALYLHEVYPACDVVVFHFRGYPPSTGRPSADALLEDAPLVHDQVAARFGDRPIVAIGFSVGSAVAARLARDRAIAGVILVTPFDSLGAVARSHYPWLPVGLLLRHRLEPARDLQGTSVPVAIIAAGRDTLIPPERTEALRRSGLAIALDRTISDAGHNDIYDRAEFRIAMQEALTAIAARGGR